MDQLSEGGRMWSKKQIESRRENSIGHRDYMNSLIIQMNFFRTQLQTRHSANGTNPGMNKADTFPWALRDLSVEEKAKPGWNCNYCYCWHHCWLSTCCVPCTQMKARHGGPSLGALGVHPTTPWGHTYLALQQMSPVKDPSIQYIHEKPISNWRFIS